MDELKPIELEIIPGILEKEWSEIEKKLEIARKFARTVHIDIIDGKFADNTTFLDPQPFKAYTDSLTLELHMMVDNPIEYLDRWAAAGFTRFIGHIEKMPDQVDFVAKAQLYGEASLAIDGKTSLDAITAPFDDLDSILVMTINAGFSGQAFDESKLEKIKTIREKTDDISETHQAVYFPIEIDGGVNDQTILKARDAGASRFVSTSYLFGNKDPKEAYDKLKKLINE